MSPTAELILANRAFLDHDAPPEAGWPASPVSGGLLAAVRPVIAPWDGRGTTWIGAGRGAHDRDYADERGFEYLPTAAGPLRHRRLYFDDATWAAHYGDVANSFLWPLLHLVRVPLPDLAICYPAPRVPDERAWDGYRRVNAAFAAAAMAEPAATCWVHDYQLALVPGMLRDRGFAGRIGFFLHTPVPLLSLARRYLDQRGMGQLREWIASILASDLAGFQTRADCDRFAELAHELCGATVTGSSLLLNGRLIRFGAYPVGIDSGEVIETAAVGAVPAALAAVSATRGPFVVGLERADFTKGIPERLKATTELFERGVVAAYAGIAAPTRPGVASYEGLDGAIERLSGEAARAAARVGARFVQLQQALDWREVVALQREADVVFTSSLADGMNLVPLQSAVAQVGRPLEQRAIVIAGRDTGAAEAFGALTGRGLNIVDPLDPAAMAETLHRAVAGQLPRVSDELIAAIRARDARAWATSFLQDLEAPSC